MIPRLDRRRAADLLRELARGPAAGAAVPHAGTAAPSWAELLFDGDALRDPAEPSQSVLAAVAVLHEQLAAHLDTVPARLLRSWLEETLGIAPLGAQPDEVVAVVTGDPRSLPVVLARGTGLRGGKTPSGRERAYETTDTLTVLGATLLGAHGSHATATADTASSWTDRAAPFAPFAGPPAEHRLDIVSDLLRFAGGTASVVLTFPHQSGSLAGVAWEHSTPDGLRTAVLVKSTATAVTLQLTGGCGPMELDGESRTFLRASFRGDAAPAGVFDFATDDVRLRMSRTAVAPDAGFYNDGALDISKEFQPFGPVPRRGDSFYLRSEEAFSKPLDTVSISLDLLDVDTDRLLAVDFAAPYQQWYVEQFAAAERATFTAKDYRPPRPGLLWQRYAAGWAPLGSGAATLPGTTSTSVGGTGPVSQPTAVAGVTGRFIRLFLANADFGWADYLQRVARFAAAAAGTGTVTAGDLVAPTPPTASRVLISYVTREVTMTDLRTRNGPAGRRLPPGGRLRPFRQPLDTTAGPAGVVTFGFALPSGRLGSALSWYAAVAPASACASAGHRHDARWDFWATDGSWRPLDVLDGTRGLRQKGMIRLVTPPDWADGCPDVSAGTGRWLRMRTATPHFVGRVDAVHLDAVVARYRPEPADLRPGQPPAPPLAAGELKGLRRPLPGVKVVNPEAGTPGRGAETPAGYPPRAAGVVRHRNRAVQGWDYERLVADAFPEVAVVRCLPHTGADGCAVPGAVGLVVVPRSPDRMPYPSVTLAERILATLGPQLPMHAALTVLCPRYEPVRVGADVVLARGVAAAEARERLTAALEDHLHPLGRGFADFGRALYTSSLVTFLEERPEVDHVSALRLLAPYEDRSRVTVDACRGLIASAGDHVLVLREQL